MYATADEMIARYGADQLTRIVSAGQAELVDSATLKAAVDQAVADAAALIDSYIAKWLPLKTPVPRLRMVAMEIARYVLYANSAAGTTEDVQKRYDDQVAWLHAVGTGRIALGADDNGTTPEPTEGPEVFGPERLFSRRTLRRL